MNQARIFKNISVVPTEGGFLKYVFKSIKFLVFIFFLRTDRPSIKQKHQRRTIGRQTWNILEGPRDLQFFQGTTEPQTLFF